MVKARGDIAVTLCERSSSMNIYAVSDLTLIASVNFEFYAQNSWIMLGEQGFDIIQNGNGYIIFFSSVEIQGFIYQLHAVEFLYDPIQGSWAGNSAYQLQLHTRVQEFTQPFQFELALDGAFATWLTQDAKDLQV